MQNALRALRATVDASMLNVTIKLLCSIIDSQYLEYSHPGLSKLILVCVKYVALSCHRVPLFRKQMKSQKLNIDCSMDNGYLSISFNSVKRGLD